MPPPWTPLGSSARYTRGRLTFREDDWQLPDGRMAVEGEITEAVSKVILLQYGYSSMSSPSARRPV